MKSVSHRLRTPNVRRALLATLLALAGVAVLAPAAGAASTFGVGEQSPQIFSDAPWRDLGLRDVRLVVSWDVTRVPYERKEVDAYLAAAEASGARVMVAFGRTRVESRQKVLPSRARYRAAFKAFRKRWPSVETFATWNEANHCSQPTCHRPERVAQYYDVLRSDCASCTIVGADVLDSSDMPQWLRAFRARARHRPRIWGLHNYLDANRFTTKGTRAMLRTVKGDVWFTETGGLVARSTRPSVRFPESRQHAAAATQWVFARLTRISPRIKRVYLYHWRPAAKRGATWDSALLDPRGRPRPAYTVFSTWVRRAARAEQLRRAR